MTVYKLRICGSNNYISRIDPEDNRCCPIGSTETVPGISNPNAIAWLTTGSAKAAAKTVEKIEGFHMSVEPYEGG